jgi:hypothetical protein
MAGQFMSMTRRKLVPLASQSKGSTNPLRFDVPKTHLLAGIWLNITGSVAGTLSAPNALGMASIVRNVRVIANSGIDLINVSGPQYHYLWRDNIEHLIDPVPSSNARSAVTATTFDVSMFLPIQINGRDPIGLFMLQNQETLLQIEVDFETDSVVATGATVTATVTPMLEFFTVPIKQEDYPPLNTIVQTLGETASVAAAGDYAYKWPRGNTYLGIYHGLGIGVSPSDAWSEYKLRVAQSDNIYRLTPALFSLEFARFHGRARLLGTMPLDMVASSGLGYYGSLRDVFNSALVTDVESVITATGAGTLHTVRRQIVQLSG